jgi:hypothetical protein
MTKYHKRHRIIATFFLLIFFPTLLPNNLFASNNGPNSFEAASFEPIDATDMVNLATGDLSYVLPLLNVPSPEGGYPLTLSNHAGIAMDQEASWVGLGWLLNPGSINRNANGYPDDISMGNDNTLAFDQGQVLNFYDAGIGVNFNGIKVGVGAYWGSNKTLGGSVALGVGPLSASVGTGTLGTTVGVGYSGSAEGLASNFTNGISFNSLRNQYADMSGQGEGISSASINLTRGDYNIESSYDGAALGGGGFYFYYGHKKIKYSLYKEDINKYNGIFYQVYQNTNGDQKFDVNKLPIYDEDNTNILDINDLAKNYLCDNILLPSSDNYKVQAQGLSGSIKPTFTEEVKLSHSNVFSDDFTVTDTNYSIQTGYFASNISFYPTMTTNDNLKLNTKIFFEFENSNSSFLRIDRSPIMRNTTGESTDANQSASDEVWRAWKYSKTEKSSIYSETNTNNNIALKTGYRKRVGKHIEVFTNEQILSGAASSQNGFIEAKNLNRNQVKTYRPESIGGYQITDTDGKVYHYSLPVINFEIWYKNFTDSNNEDSKFIERELNVPYATDWLLTAVTGPDYVDTNGNNQVDKADYGYWVEFDYGKWSDGYIWNGNPGKYDVVKGSSRNSDHYEYYRGRKQIYYLDAVRTRTHTAYFVKSIRQDAQADIFSTYQTKSANGVTGFDKINYPKKYFSATQLQSGPAITPIYNVNTQGINVLNYKGIKKTYRYADFPVQYSLKLDKIILAKNDELVINKAGGSPLVATKKAYLYENRGFQVQVCFNKTIISSSSDNIHTLDGDYLTEQSTTLQEIAIHQDQNVIDINDIASLDTNSKAQKVIKFQYDYSSMPNSFHSAATNKGKLTLNSVEFLGHKGISCIPKYQFSYFNRYTDYNLSNQDGWGYHKTSPANWSLNEITTPMGSKINIQYQSDDYNGVAAKASRVFNKGISYLITKNASNELIFQVTKNTDTGDNVVDEFNSFIDYFKINEYVGLDLFLCRRSKYGGDRREATLNINEVRGQIIAVDANSVTFKLPNSTSYWTLDSQDENWLLNRKFSLTSVKHADGSNDGVIMRESASRDCWGWRSSYDNDDIVFNYRLASSTTPNTGKGGGIRVSQVSVSDGIYAPVSKSNYYYNQIGSNKDVTNVNYKSSGVTSFVPSKEFTILPYASELPPPVIIYSNVSVEETNGIDELISRTDYKFENLNSYQNSPSSVYNVGNHLVVQKTQDYTDTSFGSLLLKFTKFNILDKISNLGRLISVQTYNAKNQQLYSLKNDYKIPADAQDELGTKQESYFSLFLRPQLNTYTSNSISKIWYPNQLVKTSVTQGGYTTSTSYDKFDFLTGEVIESTTTSSDGQSYKNKIIPAYQKYSQMGSKADNITYKNMLSQTAVNYSYIFDKNDINKPWKETGVGITTWSNIWAYKDITGNTVPATVLKDKIWRKHKSYVWNGTKDADGISRNYDSANDNNFSWSLPSGVGIDVAQPSEWKQLSEVTLYDHYSVALEMKNINNIYASTKMGDYDTKTTVTGNARYGEIFYSGAETNNGVWLDPEISITNISMLNGPLFHTGKKAVQATSTMKLTVSMKNTEHRAGKYKVSVWVEKSNVSKAIIKVDGNAISFINDNIKAGNWQLKTAYIPVPSTACTIELSSLDASIVYFDDLMVRPVSSSINGYVYNEWDEVSYIIGNNGLATKFEYDAAGRLIKTSAEVIDDPANGITTGGFKVVKTNSYNNRYLN